MDDEWAFEPMTRAGYEEVRGWFADAELARRIDRPSPAWLAHVTAGAGRGLLGSAGNRRD